ncbi:MAG: lactate racemase domain-containing protein, partial [Pirellulales bacterium]
KVALVLTEAVSQAAAIVAGLVAALSAAGIRPEDITLVRAAGETSTASDPLSGLPAELRASIVETIHDPADRGALGYVAASAAGDPIYINRAIYDADLAITIGCLRLESSLGYHGIYTSLFPAFSDAASLNRFRSLRSSEPKEREQLRQIADQAGWLLSAPFTVQVVPGAGDSVLQVLAGETRAVFREGGKLCNEAWSFQVPQKADLVIATISGASQQTWDNVARALATAATVVREGGAVAICSELADEPGTALRRIAGAEDPAAALQSIGKHKPTDMQATAEIVRALERGKVYLLSRLDEELVENLGILPVQASQLSRLAARYESCVLLENAQHTSVSVGREHSPQPRSTRSHSRT